MTSKISRFSTGAGDPPALIKWLLIFVNAYISGGLCVGKPSIVARARGGGQVVF